MTIKQLDSGADAALFAALDAYHGHADWQDALEAEASAIHERVALGHPDGRIAPTLKQIMSGEGLEAREAFNRDLEAEGYDETRLGRAYERTSAAYQKAMLIPAATPGGVAAKLRAERREFPPLPGDADRTLSLDVWNVLVADIGRLAEAAQA